MGFGFKRFLLIKCRLCESLRLSYIPFNREQRRTQGGQFVIHQLPFLGSSPKFEEPVPLAVLHLFFQNFPNPCFMRSFLVLPPAVTSVVEFEANLFGFSAELLRPPGGPWPFICKIRTSAWECNDGALGAPLPLPLLLLLLLLLPLPLSLSLPLPLPMLLPLLLPLLLLSTLLLLFALGLWSSGNVCGREGSCFDEGRSLGFGFGLVGERERERERRRGPPFSSFVL